MKGILRSDDACAYILVVDRGEGGRGEGGSVSLRITSPGFDRGCRWLTVLSVLKHGVVPGNGGVLHDYLAVGQSPNNKPAWHQTCVIQLVEL